MILKCDCKHKSQDKLNGPQMRVHNEVQVKSGAPKYRCTVCGKERQ